MSGINVEKLLHLQECDVHCDQIRRQIETFPAECAALERKIAAHRESVDEARGAVRKLELARKDLEGRVAAEEEHRRRYRTQQMSVKRNEEYKAFEVEIAACAGRISGLEDEEIVVLMKIDDATGVLRKLEKQVEEEIALLEGRIKRFRIAEGEARSELEEADRRCAEAAKEVEQDVLEAYRYVAGRVRKPPFVVPIIEKQCQGCFLRVSAEVESDARREGGFGRCDSCGRMLYFPQPGEAGTNGGR